jgi:uncharacterized phage-associated protein
VPLTFRPKVDKIVELLLYLAHKRPNADKYQAVKFLYLADREHLNRYGRPLTYEVYYALDYGPVASTALDLLNGQLGALQNIGLESLPFRTEVASLPSGKPTTFIREPFREVALDRFSKSDLRVFDEILAEYGACTFDQLYNLTHDHAAYKRAWQNRGWWSRRGLMKYEDMIDDGERKQRLIEDLEPISANM